MPFVNHFRPLCRRTARAHGEGDAFVVERNGWLGIAVSDGQQMPPPPKVVTLTFDEAARRLAGLLTESRLLVSNPA